MKQADCPTLGSYFAKLDSEFDRCKQADGPHIRRRHTKREMYEEEFERIWTAQQKHYPDLLTDALKYGSRGKQTISRRNPSSSASDPALLPKYGIHGLMFFQRKMYWPKSVVGRCELEPREKRCPRAASIAQRFRIVQEVNNIRLLDRTTRIERRLDAEEREKVIKRLMESKEVKFDQIRTLLKFPETVRFNFETTPQEARRPSPRLHAWRQEVPRQAVEGIARGRPRTPSSIFSSRKIRKRTRCGGLTTECGLTAEEAKLIAAVNFPEGYMSFSRRAIERLLPHLERGLALMGNDASDSAIHAAGYLRPDERVPNQRQFLAPVAQRHESHRPASVGRGPQDGQRRFARIGLSPRAHVGTYCTSNLPARRKNRSRNASKSVSTTPTAKRPARTPPIGSNRLQRHDQADAGKTVNRYLLWQSQEELCPYCCERICPEQLFNGEADIDHILPRWRSLDDSMGNKVVAHRRCNHEKGDRTPREWLEGGDPDRYEQVMHFAERHLSYGKQLKFAQKDIELDDFVNRQLNDTAYISRCVSQYLQCLGAKVICTRGGMTSDVRYWWGLNSILQNRRQQREEPRRSSPPRHRRPGDRPDRRKTAVRLGERPRRGRAAAVGWLSPRGRTADSGHQRLAPRTAPLARRVARRTPFTAQRKSEPRPNDVPQEKRPWAKDWIEDGKHLRATQIPRRPR